MSKADDGSEWADGRAEALLLALDKGLSSGRMDTELVEALAQLHSRCQGAQPLTALVAKAAKKRGLTSRGAWRGAAPDIQQILFLMASKDGILAADDGFAAVGSAFISAMSGVDPGERFPETCGLARSPWWETLGLLLNEARPEQAELWPLLCALSGLEWAKVRKAASNAPALSAGKSAARDQLLVLACHTRDPEMLRFGLGLKISGAPGPASQHVAAMSEALAAPHPHSAARTAMDLAKSPAMEACDMATALLERFDSPSLASALLSKVCQAQSCLPEALPPAWAQAGAAMRARGAAELGLDDVLGLATLATQRRAAALGAPVYGRPQGHWNGSRSVGLEELDAFARACVRKALGPRSVELGPQSPPMAFRLLELLPKAGPKTAGAILSAMEGWAKNGFGTKELAWSRAVSGNTQSIAWAVASLSAKGKDSPGGVGWDRQIESWLGALARQGFDFDAKASPKSKSLAERMRSTQNLKAFWPLVEAELIRAQAGPASSRKAPSL